MSTSISHVAPHSDQTEQLVLAAMLIEEDALRTALSLLRGNEELFYQPRHRALFLAAVRLNQAGQAVDLASIIWQLKKDGKAGLFEEEGSPLAATVAHISFKAASAAHLPTHCQELIELYTKRKVFQLARRLADHAYDPMQDPVELLAVAQQTLNQLTDSLQARRAVMVGELVGPVIDEIGHATQQKAAVLGVPSGLRALDAVTGGFQNSDLIIIAARPGMGKTSLALSIAEYAARVGKPGAFFTLEMGNRQLVRKMIATKSQHTTSQLLRGLLPGGLDDVARIHEQVQPLYTLPLYLDDSPGISIGEMRAKAAKMKAEYGIAFLVCDYLQLMQGDDASKGKGGGNREREISSISRGLKGIAKELDIPVIALAQLSRSVEQRGGEKKPQLSDLRESGAIEQDADLIIFPYRPEYYGIREDEMGNPTANLTELIIAKHRNGALESPVVKSMMSTGTYSDLDLSPAPAGERPMWDGEQKVALRPLPASTDFSSIGPEAGF